MRNFDATLWTEYQKRILHQFFMLEVQYNSTDRLRITETDIDVWHEGNRFRSRGFKFDNLAGSSSLQVDNLDIDIDDTDQTITQILLGQDVRNTLAILYHGVVASQDVYAGAFTAAQAEINTTEGAAAIDLGDAGIFAKYLGGKFRLVVRDSAGHELTGYIKAALGTGVTIVSARDGSTQDWASINPSFDYADANDYTYEMINEGILPVDVTPSHRIKQVIAEEYMRFIVGGWSLQDDNMARLNLTNELVLWNKKCLRQQSSSCQWVFKGTECAYAGSETWCDQSYERCKNLGNQLRFIGARFIPALTETVIWWGRTPNYTGD